MKTLLLQSEITVYANEQELSAEEVQLLKSAKAVAETAYAPYSNFRVGAAILLENGQVVLGSNQENAAYPSGLCAERTAIFAAGAQFPNVAILTVAITIISQRQNIDKPVPPCGACRQVIYEYENRYGRDIRILLQGDTGEIYGLPSIKTILPLLFDASYLK